MDRSVSNIEVNDILKVWQKKKNIIKKKRRSQRRLSNSVKKKPRLITKRGFVCKRLSPLVRVVRTEPEETTDT